MSLLQEFKTFAMRGNVVDLAVGVIIGAAFGTIINSLVNDIIMPPIAQLTNGRDLANHFLASERSTLRESCGREEGHRRSRLRQLHRHHREFHYRRVRNLFVH